MYLSVFALLPPILFDFLFVNDTKMNQLWFYVIIIELFEEPRLLTIVLIRFASFLIGLISTIIEIADGI